MVKKQKADKNKISTNKATPPDPKDKVRGIQWLSKISWLICILAGILLSLKSLREPDLWWIFRTGEWIFENFQVPRMDHFSYTMQGEEWINVKWGFEVIAYLFQQIGGPSFVYCFQAIVTVISLLLTRKIFLTFHKPLFPNNTNYPQIGLIVSVIMGLIAWEFRINGRPEMVSHCLVLGFTTILINYQEKPHKAIFWLIPLQVLWTNLHEAYGTGIIMLGAFTAGAWFDYWLFQRSIINKVNFKPLWLTATLILAILAMAVNPRGIEMIIHPWDIFQQLGANKYTTELFGFTHPNYWQYQAYLNFLFFGITLITLFLPFNKEDERARPWFLRPLAHFGSGYLLFLAMFFYLSLTAYRNIPFFILVSIPIAALGIQSIIRWLSQQSNFYRQNLQSLGYFGWGLTLILCLAFYASIPTNTYYDALDRNDRYGQQVNVVKNPVGASRFIKENEIEGRCFSGYLTSSYLMWDLRPDFKTFIDLRDLDVFPKDFFNRFAQMTKYPEVFNQADSLYGFDYVVLHRLNFKPLHKHLHQSPDFKLVFADPVALVYLKNNSTNSTVIEEHAYKKNKGNFFHRTQPVKASSLTRGINKLFWPGFEFDKYERINFDAIAADFYRQIGDLETAFEKAKEASKNSINPAKGYEALANIYLGYADQADNQQKHYRRAFEYFNKSNQLVSNNASVLINLGALSLKFGNVQEAENYLKEAIDSDPGNGRAYQYMAKVYQQKANQNRGERESLLKQRLSYLEDAYRIEPDNRQVLLSLGIGYCEMNACSDAKPYLETIRQKDLKVNKSIEKKLLKCYNKCIQ